MMYDIASVKELLHELKKYCETVDDIHYIDIIYAIKNGDEYDVSQIQCLNYNSIEILVNEFVSKIENLAWLDLRTNQTTKNIKYLFRYQPPNMEKSKED